MIPKQIPKNLKVRDDDRRGGSRPGHMQGIKRTKNHKYVGVRWLVEKGKYVARYKQKHLGCFKRAKDAALAYDKAAFEALGDQARLNFPREIE